MNVPPPSGEVTLMFTDIEGSTKAWDKYGEIYRKALEVHHSLMRQAIAEYGGYEVKTIGDSFMVAFGRPLDGALCALQMQRLIESGPFEALDQMRVRIGLHTGQLAPYGGDYYGPVVNHTARIESAGHGGQIVLSDETVRLITNRLPEGASLTDCGLHRLKDLGAPIRLFLLRDPSLPLRDYPPLRTLDLRPHNFPAQMTSFIGREKETEELTDMLLTQKARLITLTGPGGTGKTRLSMQVAAEAVQHYPDGIWLVELAGVTDAREVPSAFALALKIPLASEKSVPEQVTAYLTEKRCLLVLDNFEQVVDSAVFVSSLLKQCRDVVCLVTSQHLLQIAGETEYPLSPLMLPPANATLETCFRYASVQLFVERAQASRPQFTLTEEILPAVVEICRRLEGLPLAVELTAALVRGMTPNQILPRLEDRFKLLASSRRDLDPRQRSLRGALDWSYELLSEEERVLFAELSVFSDGFFIEDVEAVCGDCDAFMLTIALRDKSLLKTEEINDETRYIMLQTLRAYAAEKLALAANESEVRTSHARRYLQKAQEWSALLDSSGDAMQRMLTEIDNMRAGMDWSVKIEDGDIITAYARALAKFFVARGLFEEGDRRLGIAEEICRRKGDKKSLAQLLLHHGTLSAQVSDMEGAAKYYLESYTLCQSINDEERMVPAIVNLGGIAMFMSDYETARIKYSEALELARKTRQPRYEATLLQNLSGLAVDQGRFEEAQSYLEQSVQMQKESNNQKGLAIALHNYGDALKRQGKYEHALEKLNQSHHLSQEIGFEHYTALTDIATGSILLEMGSLDDAQHVAENGYSVALKMGHHRCEMLALNVLAGIAGRRGDLQSANSLFLRSAKLALIAKHSRHFTDVLFSYAMVLIQNDRPIEAFPLMDAAFRAYSDKGLHVAAEAACQIEKLKHRLTLENPEVFLQSQDDLLFRSSFLSELGIT